MSPRDFFQWFQRAVPHATSNAFRDLRTAAGHNSYELLLGAWTETLPPERVLDIGSGEGFAMRMASARWPGVRLIGIDVASVPEDGIPHVVADGGELPIASGTVDLAVLHLSLPFIPQPEAALREARRVLCRGGIISLVLPGPEPESGAFAWYRQTFRRICVERRRQIVTLPPPVPDPVAVLAAAGFGDIDLGQVEVASHADARVIWKFISTSYDWAMLDAASWTELHQACLDYVAGTPELSLSINLRTVRASAC